MAETRPSHHTRDAISVRAIVLGALVVAVAIALSMLGAYALLRVETRSVSLAMTTAKPGEPPPIEGAASLQTAPAADIAAYRGEKERLLSEYGWVDHERGIVRVPIDAAMDLFVRERNAEAER